MEKLKNTILFIMVKYKMDYDMGEGVVITQMAMFTTENFKTESAKAQEFTNGVMMMQMMENGRLA